MKKIILSVLMLSVLVMMVGVVSAEISGAEFDEPDTGDVISGATYTVEWVNDNTIPDLNLQYKEGTCSSGGWLDLWSGIPSANVSYDWNTIIVSDGDYCLRLYEHGDEETSGIFKINNVLPQCHGIISPTDLDVAVDYAVEFEENASITDGDTLTYTWDFDDGESDVENPVMYAFDSAGTYDGVVTVKDSQESSCTDSVTIIVHDLTDELLDQEVAAYYELEADFEDSTVADNQFTTGLTGVTACEVVNDAPTNLDVYNSGDECVVEWEDPDRPTNDEQGDHNVLIRVTDGIDYEFYAFTITVYSWIIHLQEGWNLISIPLVPENSNIDDVLGNVKSSVESIWSYEYGSDSTWKCRKTKTDGSWDNNYCKVEEKLSNIVPGRGYWIKIKEGAGDDIYLKGFGTQLGENSPGMPPAVEVPTNSWALIGRYGILGTTSGVAGLLNKNIALRSVRRVGSNTVHVYDVYDAGNGIMHLDDVSDLNNNEGYWLWTENHGTNNAESETYAPLDDFYPNN